ncbi:Abi family protein [Lactococcus lactis]|uniref:Abi family protein n=1 Tax=Lactococcus lactis TaxID=1358 RepID=UPI0018C83C8C|nr:Abi family protein [Lactococcus lactis]MBG1278192.1 Abi family protein [Lactococcus lactis subsp. lactis]
MPLEFKNLDEQVALLQSRGLNIKDLSIAKKLLLRSNYYDIVNGHASFLQSNTNKYIENSTFDELYAIYMFDKNIKVTFFGYIEKSESLIRTAIAYYFSKNHTESWSYLHTNNFQDKPLKVIKLFSSLEKTIDFYNKKYLTNSITHYMEKEKEVPLWVLINFLEFGKLRNFYKLMLERDKIEIANYLSRTFSNEYNREINLLPGQIDSYLENLNDIRNIVAHDNRLLKFKLKKRSKYNSSVSQNMEPQHLNSVFHVYLSMQLFLSKEQFLLFSRSLHKREKDLKKHLSTCESITILGSIGFPENWFELLTETQDK